jgi:hypothetical protein
MTCLQRQEWKRIMMNHPQTEMIRNKKIGKSLCNINKWSGAGLDKPDGILEGLVNIFQSRKR